MLVLASASPRRRELLQNAGITFTVQPSDIPEVPLAGESAKGFAERLAQEKALAVFRLNSKDPVLGADTVVVVEHDMSVVAASDWIIEVGPGAGDEGGQIVNASTPTELARTAKTQTAVYLSQSLTTRM